jgi:hypothetical protein
VKIQEALDRAMASARHVKEDHVRRVKGKRGQTDIMTFIECYRGDETVAVVSLPPHRDHMLAAAWYAAAGFSADMLAVTMDTFQTDGTATTVDGEMINPHTNKPFEQGDLSDLVQNHEGLEKGWVVEALVTQVLNRAGDDRAGMQPYKITGRVVEWLASKLPDEAKDGSYVGIVPEALRDAMTKRTIDVMMARSGLTDADFGLDEERARAHKDVAAVNVLEQKLAEAGAPFVTVLLTANPGSVREQVIRQKFPKSKIMRSGK